MTPIAAAAAGLAAVRATGRALESFPDGAAPRDLTDAYAIQDALVASFNQAPSGWKVGCTSKMAQKMSNTDAPFYGRMLAATTHDSPATLDCGPLFAPIVEPEVAFRLGRDLPAAGAPHDAAAVLAAIDAMMPAIEIVDCRYASGWPIAIEPTVADNGVHAVFVTGPAVADWRSVARPAIPLTAEVNGAMFTDGIGANALDDPLNGLVWLANRLAATGKGLVAGELVTTGNIANKPIFAQPGDQVVARFGDLGAVRVSFS